MYSKSLLFYIALIFFPISFVKFLPCFLSPHFLYISLMIVFLFSLFTFLYFFSSLSLHFSRLFSTVFFSDYLSHLSHYIPYFLSPLFTYNSPMFQSTQFLYISLIFFLLHVFTFISYFHCPSFLYLSHIIIPFNFLTFLSYMFSTCSIKKNCF